MPDLKDGRHYIGYDIERKYVKLAKQRIKKYTSQGRLFDDKDEFSVMEAKTLKCK